ncbi:hypothetical protein IAQ61_004230 [Plenodomus lingam]|uniref:uncharacterized protein n=1 Tax=Leptosphaeria maculans TaxID=5022 RepID=UPI0033213A7E|nr:hypothetical protein IAQ61_004230 [Plenodomus lingam]
MTTAYEMDGTPGATSAQARITALHDQLDTFEFIAKQPQLAMFDRMGRDLPCISQYLEGEFHEKALSARKFLREHAHKLEGSDVSEKKIKKQFRKVMRSYFASVVDYDRVFKISSRMAAAPLPAKRNVDMFRALSGSVDGHVKLAANGQLLSMYGNPGAPVPFNLTTSYDDDLQPMGMFLREWLMDPVIEYACVPVIYYLQQFGILRNRPIDYFLENINNGIIEGFEEAAICFLLVSTLAVAIGTLGVSQGLGLRIMIMSLFSFAIAFSAQFMGRRSLLVCTLITTCWQVMASKLVP